MHSKHLSFAASKSSLLTLTALVVAVGCGSSSSATGGGTSGTGGTAASGAACTTVSDCTKGSVCVGDGAVSTCAATCSVDANECGLDATCDGVGSLSITVCQPKPAAAAADAGPAATSPAKKKVPCKVDAECAALAPGAVCASFMGVHDCTIPCTADAMCNASAGGLTTKFFACTKDEGNAARTVCLPNAACLLDPLACTSVDTDGGFGFDAGF